MGKTGRGFLKSVFWVVYACSLVYFLLPSGLADTIKTPVSLPKETLTADIEDPLYGMGMQYPENLESLDVPPESDYLISGIPEPEAYSRPQPILYTAYTVKQGDMIGELAADFGLNQDTLISVNDIKNSRLIQIGQALRIPNQDGVLHTVKAGETLQGIAEKYSADSSTIILANELFSESANAGTALFIPGARMQSVELQEINGDLFIWPVRGYITSPYGYRGSPFTGVRQFHTGIDIRAATGTPIKAAMSGRVISTGYDNIMGNHVVISHHSGYRTLYAHLNVIRTKAGNYVRTGDHIGDAGSTGLSTGPHLHFTVYKNGVTVNPRLLMN
ncbi:peptidoglycan DD-metalloendopeptidase family protein [Breznakiella homolactica]|uniref:Peptidoglycan DD-metalloendopeptidase family protein n=1 Tax=Breznakiella homolactica TaxID=2798577 RepID=A0A7T8B9V5_9SPIR|nr:peptidoglycan DD-metalloendopeptidase family protein [Breznakiella homolactica]QQO08882.1 peptidoglycan DD-metalloendopeptidase family protein [Breznakiella homolactica]